MRDRQAPSLSQQRAEGYVIEGYRFLVLQGGAQNTGAVARDLWSMHASLTKQYSMCVVHHIHEKDWQQAQSELNKADALSLLCQHNMAS